MPLTADALAKALLELPGWKVSADALAVEKTFVFRDFSEAFGFMTRAALAAEALDHHPEWLNVYRTVEVRLSTHSAGGITELDLTLAAAMDRIAGT